MPYVPREPWRDPSNRRLYMKHGIWYISDTHWNRTHIFKPVSSQVSADSTRPQWRTILGWMCNHRLDVQSRAGCAIMGWIFNHRLDLWSRVKCAITGWIVNHGLDVQSWVEFWITGWILNHRLDFESQVGFAFTGWMCYSRLNVSSWVGIIIKSSWTILCDPRGRTELSPCNICHCHVLCCCYCIVSLDFFFVYCNVLERNIVASSMKPEHLFIAHQTRLRRSCQISMSASVVQVLIS